MILTDLYYKIEDKYYAFLDMLNQYVPVYKVIDPIDKVFPSLILFSGLFVIGIAVIVAWVLSSSSALPAYISVVNEDGSALTNVSFSLLLDGNSVELSTGESGTAVVLLKTARSDASISASIENYEPVDAKNITLVAGEYYKLQLALSGPRNDFPIVIQFIDESSGNLISGKSVTISFSCQIGDAPSSKSTRNGEVTVEPPAACGTLTAKDVTVTGFESVHDFEISPGTNRKVQISLKPTALPPAKKGALSVLVVDDAGRPVKDAEVVVMDGFGVTQATQLSSGLGMASFSLNEGSYQVQSKVTREGRFSDKNTVVIRQDETTSLTQNIGAIPNDKKVLYKFLDSNSSDPVEGASVWLSQGTSVLVSDGKTDSAGLFEQPVQDLNGSYHLVADHPNYVLGIFPNVVLVKKFDSNAQVARLTRLKDDAAGNPQNYGKVLVTVFDEDRKLIDNATIQLLRSGVDAPIAEKKTGKDGNVLFSRLPAGTYLARAIKEDSNKTSESFSLAVGQIQEIEVALALAKRVFRITALGGSNHVVKINNADVEVKIFDPVAQKFVKKQDGKTGSTGDFKTGGLPVGSTVAFLVSRSDYLSFHSGPYVVPPGKLSDEIKLDFWMYKKEDLAADQHIKIEFADLMDASGTVRPNVLDAGKEYWGVFNITLRDGNFDDPKISVRAGPNALPLATQNNIFIENAEAGAVLGEVSFSSSLNPSDVFATPEGVSSNNHAKLTVVTWDRLSQGTFQAKVKFSVKESLPKGSTVELHYQLAATSATGTKTTPDSTQSFTVGSGVCKQNCPTLFWAFYYSASADEPWVPLDITAPPMLLSNQPYRIGYVIYNLSQTDYTASVSFENKDTLLGLGRSSGRTQTSGFSNQLIAAQGSVETGLSQPLSILPGVGTGGLLEARVATTPDLTELSATRKQILFSIQGARNLLMDSMYDGARLTVIVRDQLTNELVKDALIEVGEINDGSVATGFSKPVQFSTLSAENGVASFSLELGENESVIVQGRKAGFATKRMEVGNEQSGSLDPGAACISLDMVSATDYPNIETEADVTRPGSVAIEISSHNCAEAFSINVKRPSFLRSSVISMDEDSFDLGTNDSKTVNISVSADAPAGIIPIWIEGKKKSQNQPKQVIGIGELWITANDDIGKGNACFGIVEKTG